MGKTKHEGPELEPSEPSSKVIPSTSVSTNSQWTELILFSEHTAAKGGSPSDPKVDLLFENDKSRECKQHKDLSSHVENSLVRDDVIYEPLSESNVVAEVFSAQGKERSPRTVYPVPSTDAVPTLNKSVNLSDNKMVDNTKLICHDSNASSLSDKFQCALVNVILRAFM